MRPVVPADWISGVPLPRVPARVKPQRENTTTAALLLASTTEWLDSKRKPTQMTVMPPIAV